MTAKLGLPQFEEDLVGTFFKLMYDAEVDFTNTFRAMTTISHEADFSAIPPQLTAAFGKELEAAEAEVCCPHSSVYCKPPSSVYCKPPSHQRDRSGSSPAGHCHRSVGACTPSVCLLALR